ncbi:hypothetical protein D2T31_04530 [Sinirhodobacter populi]|uniref:Uncharacterized protein n=1 Tax=Paenirhodobacter populi TaxID=2306993 RepID=A0A443KEQ4_9RHOB|nr:hypothetical protein [Sinirhodobacter populi]RWR31278.1 hypothetical protein D2T31_04530 [Sinirhodobacter populi]
MAATFRQSGRRENSSTVAGATTTGKFSASGQGRQAVAASGVPYGDIPISTFRIPTKPKSNRNSQAKVSEKITQLFDNKRKNLTTPMQPLYGVHQTASQPKASQQSTISQPGGYHGS